MPWTLRMTFIAFGVAVIPYLYTGWRLINALNLLLPGSERQIRLIVILVFLFLNLLPFIMLITYFLGMESEIFQLSTSVKITDVLFVFPFWIGFIAIFEIFVYLLAIDIVQWIARLSIHGLPPAAGKGFAWLKIGVIGVMLIYAGIRSYYDTYQIENNSYRLKIRNLPESLNNLDLVLVGDVQVDRFTQEKKISQLEEKVKEAAPDLLFFAGDLVTRGTHYIPQGLGVMCQMSAKVERIACIGDHDVWADAPRIARGLSDCGWTFLDNQHHLITYGNARILVTGVTYVYSIRTPAARLDSLLTHRPEADLKILLVHQPNLSVIEAAKRHGYDILLAGHTHGGQIVLKPFGIPLTPTQLENRYYAGWHILDKLNIFITNGVGLTMMPLRYHAPAEITKITLQSGN
jgi:predicted MPP superfamily phosphohydrolase